MTAIEDIPVDGIDIKRIDEDRVRFSSGQTSITVDDNQVNPVHRLEHYGLAIGFNSVDIGDASAIFYADDDYRGIISLDDIDDMLVDHILRILDERTDN